MKKIWLVSKREFLTRVKKKSFLVMTLLSPVLIVLFYGIIFYFSINKDVTDSVKTVCVVDSGNHFGKQLKNSKTIHFDFRDLSHKEAIDRINAGLYYAVIEVPEEATEIKTLEIICSEQPSLGTLDYIESQMQSVLRNSKLALNGINQELLQEINQTQIQLKTLKITDSGVEKGNSGVTTFIGFIGAFLIYLFIFLYGVQVMRGVIEEKTNRIVELIISSVKPFQLMMGKILGIAFVGLTQFVIWVLLVTVLSAPVSQLVMNLMDVNPEVIAQAQSATQVSGVSQEAVGGVGGFLQDLSHFNFLLIGGMFLFYFISGYLFYGSLFAAIGSAVDNETDTQQFMFPITMPLIFAFVLAQSSVVNSPNSSLSVWLSMIPFTSPVVMMVRLPFGVPDWQILASMASMVIGFVFTVWLASRIYRIGILTFGKKPTYREIWRWLFMSN